MIGATFVTISLLWNQLGHHSVTGFDSHRPDCACSGAPATGCLREPGLWRCAMTPIEQLHTTLAALNLAAIDARLEGLLEGAAKKEPSYADFLLEVINTEADVRRRRISRRDCNWLICPTSRPSISSTSVSNPRSMSVRSANCALCASFTRLPTSCF